MLLDTDPVTGEPREYLTFKGKRRRLDDPAAIARRRKYRQSKPKKTRIRCAHCNKRFTPKRSTKKFCRDVCRNLHNIYEHQLFKKYDVYSEWGKLPTEERSYTKRIDFLREVLASKIAI